VTTAAIVIGLLTMYQRASIALAAAGQRKRYVVAAEQ
jgi:hypothetical protein